MAPNVTASRSGASFSAPSGTLAERYDRGVGLRQKIPRKNTQICSAPPIVTR
jgi:hypothetical protein